MRKIVVSVLSIQILLQGCASIAVPKSLLSGQEGPTSIDNSIVYGDDHVDSGWGSVSLTIVFPKRSYPGFAAQTIPLSTNALSISVVRGSATESTQVVSRPNDNSPVSVSLPIRFGNNYVIQVSAYREMHPNLSTDVPIARGSMGGINIQIGKVTDASITLSPLFAPFITGLSTNVGRVGDEITISGLNLGPVQGATPSIFFGGVRATDVTCIDSASIRAKVPSGAMVGSLTISVDGLDSAPSGRFWVTKSLSIDAPSASWAVQSTDVRKILVGSTLRFAASPQFALQNPTDTGLLSDAPSVTWLLEGENFGSLDNAGLLSASNVLASGSVRAILGSLQSPSITVQTVKVNAITIWPTKFDIGSMATDSIRLTATNTMSDGSTNSVVAFRSGDPSIVSVNSTTGNCLSTGGSSENQVRIEAVSGLDVSQIATALASVYNYENGGPSLSLLSGGEVGYVDSAQTAAGRFAYINDLAVDTSGNIYIPDAGNYAIRKIDSSGRVSTLSGNGRMGMVDGSPQQAQFYWPQCVAVGPNGGLLVGDLYRLRRVTSLGSVTTVAGGDLQGNLDGMGTNARFSQIMGICTDESGTSFLIDNGSIRRVSAEGEVRTLNFNKGAPQRIALGAGGHLVVGVRELSSTGQPLYNAIYEIEKDGSVVGRRQVQEINNYETGQFGTIVVDNCGGIYYSLFASTNWSDAGANKTGIFKLAGIRGQMTTIYSGIKSTSGDSWGLGTVWGLASDGKYHLYIGDNQYEFSSGKQYSLLKVIK